MPLLEKEIKGMQMIDKAATLLFPNNVLVK